MSMKSRTYIGPYLEVKRSDYDNMPFDLYNIVTDFQGEERNEETAYLVSNVKIEDKDFEEKRRFDQNDIALFKINKDKIERETIAFLKGIKIALQYFDSNSIKYNCQYGMIISIS